MTLIRESDQAFAYLLEYFIKQSDPVLVCMFGDHQPSLNKDFLDSLYDSSNIDYLKNRYITPYIVWSNYPIDTHVKADKDISINFLEANVLELAGIQTEYSEYLIELEGKFPVIHRPGYQTIDGKWHSSEEKELELMQYAIVQYYELFDR